MKSVSNDNFPQPHSFSTTSLWTGIISLLLLPTHVAFLFKKVKKKKELGDLPWAASKHIFQCLWLLPLQSLKRLSNAVHTFPWLIREVLPVPGLHRFKFLPWKFVCNVEHPSVLQRKTSPFLHHRVSAGMKEPGVTTPIHCEHRKSKIRVQGADSSSAAKPFLLENPNGAHVHPSSFRCRNQGQHSCWTQSLNYPWKKWGSLPNFPWSSIQQTSWSKVGWPLRPLIPQENGGIRELCNDVMKPRSNT